MHKCQREMHLSYAPAQFNIASMQKDQIKQVLGRLITASGKRPTEIARQSGVSQSTLSRILNGDIESPSDRQVSKLADYFDLSSDQVRGRQAITDAEIAKISGLRMGAVGDNVTSAPPIIGMVPEISWVQAGSFTEVSFIDLDPESTNWYPRPPNCGKNAFALKVVGESMLDKYPPGRIIFIDPDVAPLSGDDVIAVMTDTGDATFKRYLEEPGVGKQLKALNPDWKDPYIAINGNCRITGVVMAQMELRQR